MYKKCSALTVKVEAAHNATPSVEEQSTALAAVKNVIVKRNFNISYLIDRRIERVYEWMEMAFL